jgi:hypothetical protein
MNGGILKGLPSGLVLAIALVAGASGVRAHMQQGLWACAGPGHWNDRDILEIGNGMAQAMTPVHRLPGVLAQRLSPIAAPMPHGPAPA